MNLQMFPTIWGIKAAGTLGGEATLGRKSALEAKATFGGEATLGGDVALRINQILTFG
jgi:hypothetical protein